MNIVDIVKLQAKLNIPMFSRISTMTITNGLEFKF